MHDITPCWLSKGCRVKGCVNEKGMTVLACGHTRCNWAILCTSQRRKCLNGNVFHTKSPDKLLCLLIKFKANSKSLFSFRVLRSHSQKGARACLVWLWNGMKMKGHTLPPLLHMLIHQAYLDSETHRSSRAPEHNLEAETDFHSRKSFTENTTAQWRPGVNQVGTAEASNCSNLWIRKEEMTFVRLSTMMLLKVPELFPEFWESLQCTPKSI